MIAAVVTATETCLTHVEVLQHNLLIAIALLSLALMGIAFAVWSGNK